MTEDEIIGWHPRLSGQESEQTLGNSEGRETWRAAVQGVTKSWTQLSDQLATTTMGMLPCKYGKI